MWNRLGKKHNRRSERRSIVVVREIGVVVEDGIYLKVILVELVSVIGISFDRGSFRRRLLFSLSVDGSSMH